MVDFFDVFFPVLVTTFPFLPCASAFTKNNVVQQNKTITFFTKKTGYFMPAFKVINYFPEKYFSLISLSSL